MQGDAAVAAHFKKYHDIQQLEDAKKKEAMKLWKEFVTQSHDLIVFAYVPAGENYIHLVHTFAVPSWLPVATHYFMLRRSIPLLP